MSNNITTYSAYDHRKSIFGTPIDIIRNFPKSHALGLRLFKRNVKAKYRQSLLGLFWAVIPPLVTAGLWIFLKNSKVADFGETTLPYAVHVLTGTLIWQVFSESVTAPMQSVTTNKKVLIKVNIPKEGLLLSGAYELFFNLVIKVTILGIVLLVFNTYPDWGILFFPLGIMSIIICGFSVGLILAPLGILYGDVQRTISLALPFLMYLTPVIYPPSNQGFIGMITRYNPLATLLTMTRDSLTGQPLEQLNHVLVITAIFIAVLLFGLTIFRVAVPRIIERIGS